MHRWAQKEERCSPERTIEMEGARKLDMCLRVKSSLTALLVGYGRRPAILPPFRSIRYHLNLCNVLPQKWQETFQYQTLKSSSDDREGIHYLRSLIRSHSKLSPTQVKLFLACCILHNLSVGCWWVLSGWYWCDAWRGWCWPWCQCYW
jgi:hypothetical protein